MEKSCWKSSTGILWDPKVKPRWSSLSSKGVETLAQRSHVWRAQSQGSQNLGKSSSLSWRWVCDPIPYSLKRINRINLKEASTELALAQRNSLLEKENHALRKELLEQKMMLLDYKNSTEAKNREEKLIRDNEDFKKEMKQQAEAQKAQMEETQRMMQKMMEMMMQKQVNP